MAIEDQGTIRPLSADTFRFQPYFRDDLVEPAVPSTTKGSEILEGLLLNQYREKPVLRQYFAAFFDEMDTLFNQLDEVYLGRFLERAVGAQLDILGAIIGQGREVVVPKIFFGFDTVPNIDGMADEATPSEGGVFASEVYDGFTSIPLEDAEYRRVLLAKSQLHNRHVISVNQLYQATITILGRVPALLKLEYTGVARRLDLNLSKEDTTQSEQLLIQYLVQYHTPLGTTLAVARI